MRPGQPSVPLAEGEERYWVGAASTITSEGDLLGCMAVVLQTGASPVGELEMKLVQTVSGFLGSQLEG